MDEEDDGRGGRGVSEVEELQEDTIGDMTRPHIELAHCVGTSPRVPPESRSIRLPSIYINTERNGTEASREKTREFARRRENSRDCTSRLKTFNLNL